MVPFVTVLVLVIIWRSPVRACVEAFASTGACLRCRAIIEVPPTPVGHSARFLLIGVATLLLDGLAA